MRFWKHCSLEYKLAKKYLDKRWYLKTYPDVATAKMDPVQHYIKFGWKEGRMPYKDFVSPGSTFNICPLVYWAMLKKYTRFKCDHFDDIVLPNDTDYDFIFPLGARCFCSEYLRILGLQEETTPFDWCAHESYVPQLKGVNKCVDIQLLNVVALIVNNYVGMFNIDDFVELYNEPGDGINRYIINKKTGLHHIHEFKKNESFDSGHGKFAERYARRINRATEYINKTKRIAFVWVQDVWNYIPRGDDDLKLTNQCLIFVMQKLKEKYKDKQIDLYIFSDDGSLAEDEIHTDIINDNIYKYTSNHEVLFKKIYSEKYKVYPVKSIYNVLSKLTLRGRKR